MTVPSSSIVDLRSDTVTRPTKDMRRAIAQAVVGDDVFGDDPTVIELERRVAALGGKEAALFVPSGTMGNQIAIHCHIRHGDKILLERDSHIFRFEQGAAAANSGALTHILAGDRGVIAPETIAELIPAEDDHAARVRLLCVENTHNMGGGAIVPLPALTQMSAIARRHGLAVHLDGARLWNASVATGIPIAEWAATADTVMMCFSKGMGAPVGSMLLGTRALIRDARRVRKRWGGGMRQAGILAAACLHALDHHIGRLADDHARARRLAEGLRALPGLTVEPPDTNIVFVDIMQETKAPAALLATLHEHGVWMSQYGPRRLRAITHLDVDDAGIERAIQAVAVALASPPAAATRH